MPPAPKLRRPLVLASIMAAMFMVAIEATIVSTAMPQIAGQLGGLHLYAWVFGAFLLAQTAVTVVFGKLADVHGRKPVLLAGIGIFLVGSVLCGLAWSLPSLIAFRLLQGVGAGAIQPVALTIVGDMYSIEERGRIQGWLASVWGVSSVLGPLAGGLIVQHLSWAWVFWINVPVGLVASAGFVAFLHEDVGRTRERVDVPGAALFTLAVASLMVALTQVGTLDLAGASAAALACAACAAAFVWQERRVAAPMLDIRLWARRPLAAANAATLGSGMAMIGLSAFLPLYVQGVMGQSALVAGFALTVMVLGWPIGATVAARNFGRFGLRQTLLLGAALLPAGSVAFLLMEPGTSPVVAGAGSFVVGLGMGFLSTAAIVIIQASVGWAERGAATASNIFARTLGNALGAAALGAVMNLHLAHGVQGAAVTLEQVQLLLDRPAGAAVDAAVRRALDHSLHVTFWGVFGVAVLTLLLAMLVPQVAVAPAKAPADARTAG